VIRAADNNGIIPVTRGETTILAAEPDPVESARLSRSLVLLGYSPETAASADGVLELIRRRMYERAVIAIELTWQGKPVVVRLARLPSVREVVALGPAGDPEMETLARLSGADAYLARPVTIESLSKVLWVPAFGKLA